MQLQGCEDLTSAGGSSTSGLSGGRDELPTSTSTPLPPLLPGTLFILRQPSFPGKPSIKHLPDIHSFGQLSRMHHCQTVLAETPINSQGSLLPSLGCPPRAAGHLCRGVRGNGLAGRLAASAGAKAFQTPGTSESQRLVATWLPSRPGFCTAGQRLYFWAGMLSSETVRALGMRGHNYPSRLTPIAMNGSTPFSAAVIVAVCLAADSKARVYLGLPPERLETASLSPSLSPFFFLMKGKGKVCFCRFVG